jgi:hypothetical protein
MITSDPYAFATLAAEQIVKGLGIVKLPVDPKAIARGRGIDVVAKPMENEGVSGMLVRYGNEFAIAYATHHENEGFENFSVAHELGHYFLPGHAEAVIAGDTGSHASRAGATDSSGRRHDLLMFSDLLWHKALSMMESAAISFLRAARMARVARVRI